MKKVFNLIIEEGPKYVISIMMIVIIFFFINKYKLNIGIISKAEFWCSKYILDNIFGDQNQDMLINILSIITGFVITIISVFGIGYSKATLKIVEAKLDKKFSNIAKEIMFVSIALLIIILFAYNIKNNEFMSFFMFIGLSYIILKFLAFGMIVFQMFEYNISESKDESEQNEKQTNEIINLLKKIAGEDEVDTGKYEQCKKFNENMIKKSR